MAQPTWLQYELLLAVRATTNAEPALKVGGVARAAFLTALALLLAGASYVLRGGFEWEAVALAAMSYIAYGLVWFCYWVPTPFLLHRDALATVGEREAEIADLKGRLHAKAIEKETAENQRETARKALTTFQALLVTSDEVKGGAKYGQVDALESWRHNAHRRWRLEVIDALELYAPEERFNFERLAVTTQRGLTYRPGMSRQWSKALDQLDAEIAALNTIADSAQGAVRALAA